MTAQDETKLPKWAQKRLKNLRQQVEHVHEKLEIIQDMNRLMSERRDWFTVPGPSFMDEEESRPLFVLERDAAHCICTLYKGDTLFVGRKWRAVAGMEYVRGSKPPTSFDLVGAVTVVAAAKEQ